ncbi:EAL domain-containing protein [Hyphomonas sp.]|uniref:EAL domain-containing protein n=1 Tax=Hyphomonas sp. TaxID=87 RepID=UPI00300309F4
MGAAALLLFSYSGLSQSIDNGLASVRMSKITRAPSGTITLVAIDAESIKIADQWPWPRERFAKVLNNLNAAGAGMIALDVDFSARSTEEGDAALQQAVENNAGWIVLPTFVQRDLKQKNTPFDAIADKAVVASVNVELSKDGRARSYRRGYFYDGHYYPTLGGVLAGVEAGDAGAFLIDYGIDVDKIDVISFDDVLNNRFDHRLVSGRSILLGATALELGDLLSTPHSPAVPGVLIHALGYESLLQGRTLTSPPHTVLIIIGLITLLLGSLLGTRVRLARLFIGHGILALGLLVVPFVVQATLPLSLNVSAILFAQLWTLAVGIRSDIVRKERDLVDQRAAYLTFIAQHDSESGMPNRRAMIDALANGFLPNGNSNRLVAAFGIERFVDLRGAIGYTHANDLVRMASVKLESAGLGDVIYHLGGSTLCVIASIEAGERTDQWLASVNAATKQTLWVAGQAIDIDLRAGVVVVDNDAIEPEQILERAALSLDYAQQKSRAVVQWGEAEFDDPQLKLALLTDISAGLLRNEFRLVYQPKYCARTHVILGVEALMRWDHPKFGAIPPDRFIEVAEETGAIDALTRWLVEQAIQDQTTMRSSGLEVNVAVNMSARSLGDPNLCQELIDKIVEAGALITVEITETAVIENPETAIRSTNAFRDAGIKLAIDDYGSGQSSIAY